MRRIPLRHMVAAVGLMSAVLAGGCMAQTGSDEPQLYGLYGWAGTYVQFADDIQKTGIRWVRVGGWDRGESDEAALLAAKNGVHLVPVLGVSGTMHDKAMPLDKAVEQMREVARKAVQRYGPAGTLWKEHGGVKPLPIRHWEIWNEPNIDFLNPPEGVLRTEAYARLLKAASEEIRKLDRGATIIAFNTAGGCPYAGRGVPPDGMWQQTKYIGWRKFIREVNDLVGAKCYDAVGTHPYTQPKAPEGLIDKGLEMLRELFKEQKADKPIWFTEVGYPLEYPNNLQVRDERQQACFMVRVFAIAAAHGVTQVQVMYITDIVYSKDNTRRSFGFFPERGKWRQQATATKVMVGLIPDPRKNVKVISEEAEGVWAYEFEGASGLRIIMAWHAGEGQVQREFKVDAKAAGLVGMLGETSELDVSADLKVKVTLSEAPVYIVPNPNDTALPAK